MAGSAVIGALRITLGINTAAFDRGLDLAHRKLTQTGKELSAIGQKMQGIGKSLSLSITAPVLAIGAGVLKLAGDFESAMNRVVAATGAAGSELKALRDAAKAFGSDKRFTATAAEAAGVMEMLAKNGLSASQIMGGAAEATLKLSAATGGDFANSADLASDIIKQFGKDASDLNAVVDKVTGALLVSKFGFDDYKLAIGQAGGVAGGLGVSFEDMNVAIASTAGLFASGSDAGTSFKTFLTKMNPTSKEAAGVMKQLGIEFFDASGKMKSLSAIAEMLRDKLGGLADEAKTSALTKMFGTDAMRTAIGLMNQGADGIARVTAEINKASAQSQMEARMKGLNGGLTQLKKAVESLAIALGDSGFLDAAARFVNAITDMIRWVAQLPPGMLKAVGALAGVAAAVGPLIFILGKLASTWGVILTLGGRLGPAWAAVGKGIGLTGAAATASTAGVGRLGLALSGTTAAATTATGAMGGLRVAMAFLGGPWGVVIGVVAAAIYYLATRTKEAAVASEEHRQRAEQLAKAQSALTGITDRLANATGKEAAAARDAAKAAAQKAAQDVRAAKAALIRANAELNLAKAMAAKATEQFKADTRSVRGAGGGVDPAMVSGGRAQKAGGAVDQAAANWVQAEKNLRTSIDTLNTLAVAINAPPKIADIKLANPSFDSGGNKKKTRKTRDDSEQREKEMLRLQHDMEMEALDGQRELLQAQRDVTAHYIDRAELSRQMVDIEHQQREKQIAFDLAMVEADKTVSAQQKAEAKLRAEKQRVLNDQLVPLRKQTINEDEELQRQAQYEQYERQTFDIKRGLLEAERNLATTAAERRRIELEILALAYRERKERLERIIRESKDADERARAEKELASLPKQQALDTQGVMQSTRGPLEDYMASLPDTAEKMNEALESVQVRGLQSLEAGLMSIIDGTKSVGEAFRDMANQIIQDLIRIAIQKAIVAAIGGGFSGGGEVGAVGMATGGFVSGPGGPMADKIPAMLSNGEFVVNAKSTKAFLPLLKSINQGGIRRAAGGMVVARTSPSERLRVSNDNEDIRGGITFDLRGAVMTQDLLRQMNEIGAQAANQGGNLGVQRMRDLNQRTFGRAAR